MSRESEPLSGESRPLYGEFPTLSRELRALSGESWLDAAPAHWPRKKLKYVAALRSGEGITADEIAPTGDYPVYGGNGLRGYTSAYTHEGDRVLIGRQGALCGNVNYASGRFWASEHAVVAELRDDGDVRWLGELLRAMDLGQYSQSAAQPGLAVDVIANLEISVPPVEEQRAIADLLDVETARLDALVAAKERLLGLLAEKRRAFVTRAVTRGLDESAAMRDSGVAWLGVIPAHWEFGNIRRFAAMKTGHTPDRKNPGYWRDCHIPWFSLADVWQLRDERELFMRETKEQISDLGLANSAAELLPAGTVGFSRTASIGFSGIMPQPMATTQDFWNWVPTAKLTSEYLLYTFRAMQPVFDQLAFGSTHRTIYQTDAAELRICVPPITEQRAIVAYIAAETARLDALRAAAERTLALLRGRRAALITAAVTGALTASAV